MNGDSVGQPSGPFGTLRVDGVRQTVGGRPAPAVGDAPATELSVPGITESTSGTCHMRPCSSHIVLNPRSTSAQGSDSAQSGVEELDPDMGGAMPLLTGAGIAVIGTSDAAVLDGPVADVAAAVLGGGGNGLYDTTELPDGTATDRAGRVSAGSGVAIRSGSAAGHACVAGAPGPTSAPGGTSVKVATAAAATAAATPNGTTTRTHLRRAGAHGRSGTTNASARARSISRIRCSMSSVIAHPFHHEVRLRRASRP